MTAFMPVCLNCAVYSWDQVKVPSPEGPFYIKEASSEPLQRCQKCKMAHYCDKDCQKEHWVKVHKERCKFSRGDKIQEAGVHRHLASLCLACKEENVMGEVVKSKEDPHWGCHLQSSHEFWNNPTLTFRGRDGQLYDGPLAMELGELTGQFTSRVEQVVSVLQKILHKMELTRHELSTREQFQELDQELFHLRHDFLMKAANIPAGRLVHHSHSVHVMNSGAQRNILGIIRALGKDYADSTKDIFRLWDTFILIFDYFLDVQKDNMKDFEDLGRKVKDRQVKLLVAQAEPSERVQEKWQQVVTALSSGLAPYCKLLEIVLGNLQQKCSVCMVNIKIESTFGDHPSGSLKERKPVAICQGQLTKFHCGKEKCRTDVREMHVKDQVAIMQYVMKAIKEHRKDRCDWCNTLKRVVHRCSKCLTKVYCSEECHDLDWEKVHKDICREKSDIRKLKMSRKSRVMEDSELPETITLKDGRVMVKISGETQRVITCPAAPCPDPQDDLVGFYRHELILYIPWGAPGQPNFLKMSDSDIVKFYTRKKKDIEIVRRKLEADGSSDDSSAASFKHVNKRGQQVVYAD